MSYNNIGLTTPRGSGTSGHVQRNLSNIQSRDPHSVHSRPKYDQDQSFKHRKPDDSILEHDRKRRIENKCVELQLTLEEDGLDESLIEIQVNELRTKLLSEDISKEKLTLKPHQTHELAALKAKENDKFRAAMGVKSDYVEGEAFNKDIQLQKKQQAIEEREKRDQERALRISAQKESREEREKHQEAIQKEMKARREEAERRRSLLDQEKTDRRPNTTLADRIQPPLSTGGHHRRRRDSDDDRRRHRSRTPSGSPPPPPPRNNRYRGNEPDVYRPSRRRSVSRSRSPPRRRRPSRSLSRSPPRRRHHSRSPPTRREGRDRSSSRSRSRSIDSDRQSPRKKSKHSSDTPPPPGFRAFHQSETTRTSSRVKSRSPVNESRRVSRGRSHSPVEKSRKSSRARSRSPSEETRVRSRVRSRSPPPSSRSRRSKSIGSDREGSMHMSDASD